MRYFQAALVAGAIFIASRLLLYPLFGNQIWYVALPLAIAAGFLVARRRKTAGTAYKPSSRTSPPAMDGDTRTAATIPREPTLDELRAAMSSGDLGSRARAARMLGDLGDLESVSLLVDGIVDEYLERGELADWYEAIVSATDGWTPIGGTDEIKRRHAAIRSANLAGTCRDAICRIGAAALPQVQESMTTFEHRTAQWHASSRAGLAQFLIELLEKLDPTAATDELSRIRDGL